LPLAFLEGSRGRYTFYLYFFERSFLFNVQKLEIYFGGGGGVVFGKLGAIFVPCPKT